MSEQEFQFMNALAALALVAIPLLSIVVASQWYAIRRLRELIGRRPDVAIHRTAEGRWTITISKLDDLTSEQQRMMGDLLDYVSGLDLP